jgi:hypothetical protein
MVYSGDPQMLFGISKIMIGGAGIIISFFSLIPSIKNILTRINNKSYFGHEPYLTALVITIIICGAISAWGLKTIISTFQGIKRHHIPVPPQFGDYSEVENALVKKQLQPYETALGYVIKKDEQFVKEFLFFLGFVTFGFLVKMILPEKFFWNLRLYPRDFSFPFFLMILLATTAALRWASAYFHSSIENPETEGYQVLKSIRTEADPDTLVPGIERSLLQLQQGEKSNMVFRSGFSENGEAVKGTGKIHRKLFIETHPKLIQYVRRPIMYLYLFLAIILINTGFLFMTKLPPDNISVLTVPIIAINFAWSIIKGGILVFSGAGLLMCIYRVSRVYRFKSVMLYVEIDGIYEKLAAAAGTTGDGFSASSRSGVQSDCDFNVFATTLSTEMDMFIGNRQIIKMTAEQDSENAKKMAAVTIESFEFDQVIEEYNFSTEKEEE